MHIITNDLLTNNGGLSLFTDSNAQLTSSSGIFTFCPEESVTLTCSLSSSLHIWRLSTSTTDIVLVEGLQQEDSSGNIIFIVTAHTGGTLTMSTMTFTASEDVISNGTSVFCGGASNDNPRVTFNVTVNIFGENYSYINIDISYYMLDLLKFLSTHR